MRKKFISKLLAAAMAVSLLSGVPQPTVAASEPAADGQTATISGTLFDAKGEALADKTVTLRERSTKDAASRYTVTTDAQGKYSKEVPAGVYQIVGYPYDAALKEATPTNVRAVAQVVTADSGTQVKQDLQVPVPITVPNGEFDNDDFSEADWLVDDGSTGAAQKVENGKQYSGTNRFRIWLSSNFQFNVHQTLSDLEEGTYAISFMAQSGDLGTDDILYAYVKDAQGRIISQENLITASTDWEAVGLTVKVGESPITVGFCGQMTKNAWANVDEFRMGRLPDQTEPEVYTKEQLKTLLDQANSFAEADYTKASYEALATPKAEAQTVYNKANATDDEITAAYKALKKAIDGLVPAKKAGDAKFQNDTFWRDMDGNFIYSQGGGIFKFGDKYYWYGVKYEEAEKYAADPTTGPYSTSPSPKFLGVTCYSSTDLETWKDEGLVVKREEVSDRAEMNGKSVDWVGRLGVACVEGTYALFVQHECEDPDNSMDGNVDSDAYSKQVLVLTSDSPTGEFKWNQRINMYGPDYTGGTTNTGDQTVFTDDDGTSYLVYSYGSGRGRIFLSKIVKQADGKIGLAKSHKIYQGAGREGNCMFKYNGKYYVCASDLYGWNASHAYYMVLDSLEDSYLDSFSPITSMKLMDGSSEDFCHVTQTGFFYTVKGSAQETVIFCGDRWSNFAKNGLGYNQWCPLSFKADGTPYFNSLSAWDLDLATGTWSVHESNNYVKNGSFDADRVAQKELAGWTNTVNKGNSPINNNDEEVTGKYALKLGDSVDFDCKVSQVIAQNTQTADAVELPNGVYNLTAKVKNSGTFDELSMYVKSGSLTKKFMINTTHAKYTEITLPDVAVSENKAEVGFIAKGKKGASVLIDDVALVRSAEQDTAAGKISCTVTSDVGKEATITATSEDASVTYMYEAELKSGANTYVLEPIKAGTYKVDIDVHSCNVTGGGQTVTVAAGETAVVPAITVVNQGGNVTGKVVDDSGEGIEGVTVSLVQDGQEEPISVQTEADGTYTIEDVLAGAYTIQVVKDGYGAPQQAQTVTIEVGKTAAASLITMEKQVGTISGKVFDQSGEPVSGATVAVRGNRDMNDARRFTVQTGEDGSYTIDVMAGTYQVRTGQEDVSVQAVAETITVEAKQSYTADLRLPKSVSLPNGDFENALNASTDWTNTGSAGKQTTRAADVLSGKGGYNIWSENNYTVELNQTLKNLRNGTYIINLKAESGDFTEGDELYFYAKDSKGELLGKQDIPNVTITKGEVLGLVAEVTDKTLTVGISGHLTGGAWSHVDDFCVGRIVPLDADSVAAEAVMDQIDAIGTVAATDASKAKIDAARNAFDALTETQKKLVDNIEVLTNAEDKYAELSKKGEDQDAAKAVIDLINSIGNVDASEASKAKIEEARAAYDRLTDAQKALVTNFSILTEAEAKYEEVSQPVVADKIDISKATVAAIPAQTYTGKALTPTVKVTYGGKTLVKDTDYKLSYKNNKNIGTATVTITGAGTYEKSQSKTFNITVKKNGTYTVGNYKYKITSAKVNGKGTVTVTGGKKKTLKSVSIGATVKIGGKSFKITSIGKNAFKGYKKLTSVTVGKNVTKMEQGAFMSCSKLKKIKISSASLKSVGKNAIKGINKKATIQCPKKQLAKYKKLFKSSTGYKKTMKVKK